MLKRKFIIIGTVFFMALVACGKQVEPTNTPDPGEIIEPLLPTESTASKATGRPTTTSAPQSLPIPINPQVFLDDAFAALESAESYRSITDMTVTWSYMDNSSVGRSIYDLTNQPPDRAQGITTTDTAGKAKKQELIIIGDSFYMKDTDSGEWKLDPSAQNLITEAMFLWIQDVEDLNVVGTETLDGLPVYHLRAGKTNVDEIIGAFLPEAKGADKPTDVEAEYQIDYWVSLENGRLIKNTMVGEMTMPMWMTESSGNEVEFEMTLVIESETLFSEYDAPVQIEAPELPTRPEIAGIDLDAWLTAFPVDAPSLQLSPDGSGDYPDLTTAVASVKPGTILFLEAGTYILEEPLEIDKSIGLVGSGMGQTEIISEAEGYVVRYSGDGPFTIEDISFQHKGEAPADVVLVLGGEITFARCGFSGAVSIQEDGDWHAGLHLQGNTAGQVLGCLIVDNDGDGVWIDDQARPTLESNFFEANQGSGIFVGGKAQPLLEKNVCTGNINGINFADESGGVARENNCSGNQEGIFVSDQSSPTLEGNICVGNQFSGIAYSDFAAGVARQNECTGNDVGIEVSGSARPTLEENICSNNYVGIKVLEGAGIGLEGAAEPTLEGNICRNNEESGIKYLDGNGGIARGNECSENGGPGIFVAEWSQPTLERNSCIGNATAGLTYASETGGVARNNDFSGNQYFGIEVGGDTQPILESNNCSGNGLAGIGFFDNSGGVARQNECSGNIVGIFVNDLAQPMLEENILADNEQDGIGYAGSSGGVARQNECSGNVIGIRIMDNADPELVNNNCHDNTEADVRDERP